MLRIVANVMLFLSLAFSGTGVMAQTPESTRQTGEPAPTAAAVKPPVERKLLPVDEGGSDPSWVAFRNHLLAALQRGDRATLIGIIDRNIVNGLEAPRGMIEFRKLWDIDTKDDRLLRELSTALNLGSAWHQRGKGTRMLCAPYVPIKWPLNDVDPYDSGAIVIKEALVKSRPSHTSETLGTLSFDIIGVRDWDVADAENQIKQRWVKVDHRGRDGYVPEEHIRSAIEHRACFAKTGNTWRMIEYVVGIEFLGGQ